jgi:hypothetical protein
MSDDRRILEYRIDEEDSLHGRFNKLILYVVLTAGVAVLVTIVFLANTLKRD